MDNLQHLFCDYSMNKICRSYIKSWGCYFNILNGELFITILVISFGIDFQQECRCLISFKIYSWGCYYIKWNFMKISKHSQTISPNFVCCITICNNTISTNKYGINFSFTHYLSAILSVISVNGVLFALIPKYLI